MRQEVLAIHCVDAYIIDWGFVVKKTYKNTQIIVVTEKENHSIKIQHTTLPDQTRESNPVKEEQLKIFRDTEKNQLIVFRNIE